MPQIYCLLDDKKRPENHGLKTYYEYNEPLFKKMNAEGWGIYFAVNEFKASPDEMEALRIKKELKHITLRNEEFTSKLQSVYCDIDIAKRGDNQTRQQKEEKKQPVVLALLDLCPPSEIIDTSNGVQPLWHLEDIEVNEENKARYKKIIKGITAWTKQFGCFCDGVFDCARILRLPEYDHMKESPYPCKIIFKTETKYTLDYLESKFPFEEIKKEIKPIHITDSSNPVFNAIEQIDAKDIFIRAFASTGRPITFDKSGRMIDPVGGTTGTFLGKKGNRDYLASSSHEPFEGNKITGTAEILACSYSDAYKWICREYNLDFKKLLQEEIVKKEIEIMKTITVKEDYKLRYTWGTRKLDVSFAIIKRGNFIVTAAKSGSGKTTFVFNMACKNAVKGHKVLFLSLEMDEMDIKEDFGRKYAGITIEEELDYKIPEGKQKSFEDKIKEIEGIENLKIVGMRRSGDVQWEDIVEVIKQNGNTDLVFIDNLDLISGKDKEDDLQRQKRIVKSILNFTSLTKIPVILIHHYRKTPANGKDKGLDEMTGSGKIRDGADRIIKVSRVLDIEAKYPDKFMTTIYLQKGRGYPEAMHQVFFIRGDFVDDPPSEAVYLNRDLAKVWWNKDEKEEEETFGFGGEVIK